MKNILLIEDDHWLGDSYGRILTRGGYGVTRADSAETAMRAVEESAPDCIVADIMLEGHTVFALLHELQSYNDTRRIPVILCSNLNHTALSQTRLHHYGVISVLDKATLTPDSLELAIKEVL